MTQRLVIRNPKYTDINGMIKVNEACLPENYPREYWLTLMQDKTRSYVALNGLQIVGYIVCQWLADKKEGRIVSFAVSESYRGHGLGKILLRSCLNTLRGCPVSLHVRKSNETAQKLYRSHGFEIDHIEASYYNNPIDDAYYMIRCSTETYETIRKFKISPQPLPCEQPNS